MPTKTIDLDTSSANFLKFDTNTLVIDESNNRVGIGVSSPSTQFHLEGTASYIRSKNTSADTDEKAWDFNAGTDGKFRFRSVNDAGSESNNWLQVDRDGVDINAINFYTGNESVCMKMDSSGNVGIGKTPSTWLLDVDSTGVEVASFDGSNNTGIVINSSSGESDIIGYSNSASTYNRINIRGAGGTGLVVDTSNNVGIGGAPSARLHLYGSEAEKFRIERTTDGNSTMGWKNTNDSWYAGITNTQNFSISQNADIGSGTEFVIEDETGHVGIGVIPDQELHIKDATGHCNVLIESVTDSAQLFLDSNTDGAGTASSEIYFKDNGDIKWRLRKPDTNRFQIYDEAREDSSLEIVGNGDMELMPSGGNVGIGKAPSSKLDIKLSTEDLEIVDAGSASATEQDWIEVEVGGVQGYIRVYATK